MEDMHNPKKFYYRRSDAKGRFLPNDEKFKYQIRLLRQNQTKAELMLWKRLRGKQLGGYKFYRQFPVNGYVLDFFCRGKDLGVEIDGSIHDLKEVQQKDEYRQKSLEELGIMVVRFSDADVYERIDEVLQKILETLEMR